MINNVREQQFETSGQLIANVKKIIKNIDKNITVTRVYITGEQAENSLKNRPIAASPLDKQQNFSVVIDMLISSNTLVIKTSIHHRRLVPRMERSTTGSTPNI